MKSRKKPVALLTDTLPVELPIIFSNKKLYEHIVNNIEDWNSITFKDSKTNKNLLRYTVPYTFLINKNDSEKRKMRLVHPLAQLQITKFIEVYDSVIINFFVQNNLFSIRYPNGINNFQKKIPEKFLEETTWVLDSTSENNENIREEFIKNYFNLSRFPKITDFYKSYYLKHIEVKYRFLTKLDYQQCFDSIYTHSLDWAYLGDKEIAKENLDNSLERFSGLLDKVAQTINYNETNGIVVGPEFSRTLAEFVLTRLDNTLYSKLLEQGIIFKRDYEIVRFIDDIFIFYNDSNVGELIENEIKIISLDYKLSINDNKKVIEKRPFLRNHLWVPKLKKELQTIFNYLISTEIEATRFCYDNFYENIRLLLHEYNEHGKYIVSYSISSFEKKIKKIIKNIEAKNDEELLYFHFSRLIDLFTFLLTYSLKSENVFKLSRIILMMKKSAEKANFDINDLIFMKLFNVLKFNKDKFVDLLNIILILTFNENNLPPSYFLNSLKENKDYFAISVITFYIINKRDGNIYYRDIIDKINEIIFNSILEIKTRFSTNKKRKSDETNFDEIDDVLTSGYFYLIHDIYSSGILNSKNKMEIKNIIKKISTSKTGKGMEIYNLFLDYIKDFDQPFMNWKAGFDEIVTDMFISKYKKVYAYE
ncbi:RNA-directed DNA polymerase [Aneurinibacillus sp. REN35]|uniref:RNA-directed DNA polymerase n=1 Tax=Aneurinibacillus sp. REN35 TaxID=3237286 RepID=UPI003526FD50